MVRPMAFSVVLASIALVLATTSAEPDQFDVSVCAAYQDAQSRNQCCNELNVPPSQCKHVSQPTIRTPAPTPAAASPPEKAPRQITRQVTRERTVERSLENPVCAIPKRKASDDVKARLREKYPDSYSLQKTLYDADMKAYKFLCSEPPSNVNVRILSKRLLKYYPHFSLIKTLYEADKKAYGELYR